MICIVAFDVACCTIYFSVGAADYNRNFCKHTFFLFIKKKCLGPVSWCWAAIYGNFIWLFPGLGVEYKFYYISRENVPLFSHDDLTVVGLVDGPTKYSSYISRQPCLILIAGTFYVSKSSECLTSCERYLVWDILSDDLIKRWEKITIEWKIIIIETHEKNCITKFLFYSLVHKSCNLHFSNHFLMNRLLRYSNFSLVMLSFRN